MYCQTGEKLPFHIAYIVEQNSDGLIILFGHGDVRIVNVDAQQGPGSLKQ